MLIRPPLVQGVNGCISQRYEGGRGKAVCGAFGLGAGAHGILESSVNSVIEKVLAHVSFSAARSMRDAAYLSASESGRHMREIGESSVNSVIMESSVDSVIGDMVAHVSSCVARSMRLNSISASQITREVVVELSELSYSLGDEIACLKNVLKKEREDLADTLMSLKALRDMEKV